MDPNFKNFMTWKKSVRGREFIAQKDKEELDDLIKSGIEYYLYY